MLANLRSGGHSVLKFRVVHDPGQLRQGTASQAAEKPDEAAEKLNSHSGG